MSMFEIVTFNASFGGYWVKKRTGDVGYIGGDVKTIECKPEELFTFLLDEFGEGLYMHRLWYTLPFEDHKDRKKLSHVRDASFKEMCEAGQWKGVLNLFLVSTVDHPEEEQIQEPCEEEIRVERNVAGFVDEDEDFDYHNTPPNSDGEEEEDMLRFKPGSGHLELRQVFDTIEDFKDALVEYALKGGWNIKRNKWGKIKCGAVCGSKDKCPWRIYCSYEERYGKWMVKTYEDGHKCQKDGYSKLLKSGVILKLFMDEIRNDVDLKPKYMQEQIEQRFNLITTIDKCKKAKRKALDIISRDHEEQFCRESRESVGEEEQKG